MAELKLFTSGELFPPSCHLQIVTDQQNMDSYIGTDFEIKVPTTLQLMKPEFRPLPQISIANFKPPTCFLAFFMFLPPQNNATKEFKDKLYSSVHSVKTFINLYNYTKFEHLILFRFLNNYSLKNKVNIFWFTTQEVVASPELFPRNEFFSAGQYHYSTLFLVPVREGSDIRTDKWMEINYVCLHCEHTGEIVTFLAVANISRNANNIVSKGGIIQTKNNCLNFLAYVDTVKMKTGLVVILSEVRFDLSENCGKRLVKGVNTDKTWDAVAKSFCGSNVTIRSYKIGGELDTFPFMRDEKTLVDGFVQNTLLQFE